MLCSEGERPGVRTTNQFQSGVQGVFQNRGTNPQSGGSSGNQVASIPGFATTLLPGTSNRQVCKIEDFLDIYVGEGIIHHASFNILPSKDKSD